MQYERSMQSMEEMEAFCFHPEVLTNCNHSSVM
ncbi:unnamed protein product [Callosobruchus maculatus]|uniref:Uncharacterized protein n=1 Tax=Callosobruchus maculatus TaxID=64391 RepID=A0A653BHN2_CALMS|nr:unnamed protein product [Callosobruchus maculatus]